MDTGFHALFDSDIIKSIHDLLRETSKVKTEIFKTITMNKNLDISLIKYYLSYVDNFLRYWDNYSSMLGERIKNTNPVTGIKTIDYEYIKNYIYSSYDYASLLEFTDGVIRGVEDKVFKKPHDIEDFFIKTVHNAFIEKDSVAELLDSVLEKGYELDNNQIVGPREVMLFKSIRNYNKLFDHRVPNIVNKAVDRTMETLTRELPSIKLSLDYNAIRLFVSIVNNVIEYITYTLTAYATRVYIIFRYTFPFIYAYEDNSKPALIKESTEGSYDNGLRIFKDMEDLDVIDPSKLGVFCDAFVKFLASIGNGVFNQDSPACYSSYTISDKTLVENKFCQKIIANPLYLFISKDRHNSFNPFNTNGKVMINELNQNLKTFLYNSKQGLQGVTTPKQELLHIIRGEECEETLSGYKSLAKDLYILALYMGHNTKSFIDDMKHWINKELEEPNNSLSDCSMANENSKMLTEFYRDIMSAILFKARHIEMKINDFHASNSNKTFNDMSISIPGQKKSDTDLSSNMGSVVPETMRMPMELIDAYALPNFESMQMFDEYLKSLPEFTNDVYFTEGVSDLYNKLKALLIAFSKQVNVFFNNASTKAAFKWVNDHEKELKEIKFTSEDELKKCYPLKDNITLPDGFKNLITNLQNFDSKILESDELIKKFIKSLYPSENIYNWFNSNDSKFSDGNKSLAPQMYRNLILFQDMNNITTKAPELVTYQGDQLKLKFYGWVDTVKSGPDIYKQYVDLDKSLTSAVDKIQSVIVNYKPAEKSDEISNDNKDISKADDTSGDNKGSNSSNTNSSNSNTNSDQAVVKTANGTTNSTSNADSVITDITKVITNIWSPLGNMICQAIKQEYKYLKMIYVAKSKESKENS